MMNSNEQLAVPPDEDERARQSVFHLHPINRFRLMYGKDLFDIPEEFPGWKCGLNWTQATYILHVDKLPSAKDMRYLNPNWAPDVEIQER